MSETGPTCQYRACEDPATVARQTTRSGHRFYYCGDHDPLDDPAMADHFEEVPGHV